MGLLKSRRSKCFILSLLLLTILVGYSNLVKASEYSDATKMINIAVSAEIYQIQGASHESPMAGQAVKAVDGIITAIDSNGFYLQEMVDDLDDATSAAIYVLSNKRNNSGDKINVGDKVTVAGHVEEYYIDYPNDAFWVDEERQLSITAIKETSLALESSGNPLPQAIILGSDRVIPVPTIGDDNFGNFEPSNDAIDFYESIEGMRVQVDNALVVGSTKYGQTAVLANGGKNNNGVRTEYGGITISASDYNPERIIVETETLEKMDVNGDGYADSFDVGATFNKPFVGVIGYYEGKYLLYNTAKFTSEDNFTRANNTQRDITTLNHVAEDLRIASFNVENLSAAEQRRMDDVADTIVNNLASPDIIGLVEIQDNSGDTNDGIVAADQTYQKLINAINTIDGTLNYEFVNIDPVDGEDGGKPGGNIRVGFLYNPARVSFTEVAGGDATTAVTVKNDGSLSSNPGRVYPTDPAFAGSRKPLAAEFEFNGEKITVIANHLSSKGGDAPLFGNQQPPVLASEAERIAQAEVVNGFVDEILVANPTANVVVLGDMNDFEFSTSLDKLAGNALTNMVTTLPESERFTYIFEGNSQVLDHILVSDNLSTNTTADIVNLNSIYAEHGLIGIISDHDPVMVRISGLGIQ